MKIFVYSRARFVACAFCIGAPLSMSTMKTFAADSGADTLSTVIVTANKIDQSIMNTPASVEVLDARDLESRAGLTTVKDVLATTPNIVYTGTGNTAPAIRGVDGTGASQGSDAFIAGSRSRINMQIDGRPASYNEIVFADSAMWDVKQVEVLRGAQSTLQGRNAIAGTIVTKTNDPSYEAGGALRLAAGNYDQRRASAMATGPIIDNSVAYRLAADWMEKTSYVDGWQGFKGVDDPRDFEALNLRGKLLLEPQAIDAWKTLVTINHSDYTGPQTENVDRPFDKHTSSFLYEPVFEPKSTSAIIDSNYALNSNITLEGLLTGTDLNVKRKAQPGDGIAISITTNT
jgi:outer membrane receptor protein involved in Fe transport